MSSGDLPPGADRATIRPDGLQFPRTRFRTGAKGKSAHRALSVNLTRPVSFRVAPSARHCVSTDHKHHCARERDVSIIHASCVARDVAGPSTGRYFAAEAGSREGLELPNENRLRETPQRRRTAAVSLPWTPRRPSARRLLRRRANSLCGSRISGEMSSHCRAS